MRKIRIVEALPKTDKTEIRRSIDMDEDSPLFDLPVYSKAKETGFIALESGAFQELVDLIAEAK